MHQRSVSAVLFALGMSQLPAAAYAQSATYHLHKEVSKNNGLLQLKSAPPDSAATTVASVDFKNKPPNEYLVKAFDTPAGTPNAAGTIPAGSVVSLTLWMRKSANAATIYPRARVNLNSAAGASLCAATGAAPLTTTLVAYTLECAVGSNVSMTAVDRFYLWVGVTVTTAAGKTGVKGELAIEGAVNGNYDSRIVAPLPILPPAISNLSPASGAAGTAITITGSNFGAAQDASRVTFNGVAATPGSWSATLITAAVPAGATTGPVVVSVRGLASNGAPFTVPLAPGNIGGRVARTDTGAPIAGAGITAISGPSSGGATSDAAGEYTIVSLPAGSYTVTAGADGYRSATAAGVGVTNGTTTTYNFALEQGVVTYAYDELDRLIAVVDPAGASAAYRYDAVGNVVAIVRQDVEAPSILGVSPTSGAAGARVTITGTAFSATASANTVAFHGSPASVVAATHTQLITTVPAGATSGPVTVASPSGNAVSTGPFTVITGSGAPAITTFAPTIAAAGTPVVISGSNFDVTPGNTRVRQNVSLMFPTTMSAGAIEAPVPLAATSGHVSVQTTQGSAVSPGVLFVPPAPYAATDVGFTAVGTIGEPLALPTPPGKIGLIAFDGIAGQRVAVRLASQAWKYLLDPYGNDIGDFWSFLGLRTLPIDGTYTVVQSRCVNLCGSTFSATVLEVPPDITAAIAVDDPPLAFDITAPGQRVRLQFAGAAGQHVGIALRAGTPTCCLTTSVVDPVGREVFIAYPLLGVDNPIDVVLPATGSHSVILDTGGRFDTAHFTLALFNIADAFVTADVDGPAVTATTTEAAADIHASFVATAGARIALLISDVTLPVSSRVSIRNPDGTMLLEQDLGTGHTPYGHDIDLGTLAQSGAYAVFIDVDPYLVGGSVTLQVVTETSAQR